MKQLMIGQTEGTQIKWIYKKCVVLLLICDVSTYIKENSNKQNNYSYKAVSRFHTENSFFFPPPKRKWKKELAKYKQRQYMHLLQKSNGLLIIMIQHFYKVSYN